MAFTPRDEGYVPPHLPTIKREVNKLMDGVKRVGAKQTNVFVSATSGYLIGNITRGAWVGRLTPVERCPAMDVVPPKWFARSVEKALRVGTPQQVAYGHTLLVLAEATYQGSGCITLSDNHPLAVGADGQPAIAQFCLDYGTVWAYDRHGNIIGRPIGKNRLAQILTANLGEIAFME